MAAGPGGGRDSSLGLWLGWLARLVVLALTVAGQIVSLAIGLSNVLQPDPALGTQNAALARLLTVAAPVLLLATRPAHLAADGARRQLPDHSGRRAPADGRHDVASSSDAVGACFALALRLAAPFLAASLLWHAVLGLAARLASHLQPVSLSAPVQLLGGLVLLATVPAGLLALWSGRAAELLAALPGLG